MSLTPHSCGSAQKVIKVGEPYLQELFKAAQPDLARIAQFACSIGTAYLELGKGDKATEYANLGLTHQVRRRLWGGLFASRGWRRAL